RFQLGDTSRFLSQGFLALHNDEIIARFGARRVDAVQHLGHKAVVNRANNHANGATLAHFKAFGHPIRRVVMGGSKFAHALFGFFPDLIAVVQSLGHGGNRKVKRLRNIPQCQVCHILPENNVVIYQRYAILTIESHNAQGARMNVTRMRSCLSCGCLCNSLAVSLSLDMLKKDRYRAFVDYFSTHNPDAKTELNYGTPFELLIAVILSAQCTDKRINQVTPALFERFPDPESLAAASVEEVFSYIRSVSYPN